VINVEEAIESITEPWKTSVLAEANGFQMKIAMAHGEFPWHVHDNQDELFHCVKGTFTIELEVADNVTLRPGDVFVVPKGTRHRPVAEEPAVTLLFEPAETKQYGD
jgi:quercetin dioxygenase-like cupin family protein